MRDAKAQEISDGILQMYRSRDAGFLAKMAADDFVFWDNVSVVEKTVDTIMTEFNQHVGQFESLDATPVRFEPLSDGFLLQYVVQGFVERDESAKDQHVCLIVRLKEGRIARIDEYCDSGG